MIDSMFQEGTDSALDDQVRRPRAVPPAASAFSLLGLGAAPFRGIGGGLSKTIAFGSEVVGAFGQVAGAYDTGPNATPEQQKQAEAARQKLLTQGIDYSNEAGDTFRQRAADILPDPKTAHTSEQVVAGLADFATRAIGYGVTTGGLAPFLLGGDVGMEESDRLKREGVDIGTRTKAGATAGAIAGLSIAVPMGGPTRLARAGAGVVVGEAGTVGTALAEREILRAAGYEHLANQFDPLDPVALAVGAVPGVLGFAMRNPKRIAKPLKTEADVRTAATLTPEEQAHENAYEASATNLASLERAIAAEKSPEVRALLQEELTKQRTAAREMAVQAAVHTEPDLVPAARVGQVAEALDATRLTPDADLAGRDAHLSAVEMAGDQIGRGEDVQVRLPTERSPFEPVALEDSRNRPLDGLRATFDNGQGSQGMIELGIRDGRMFPTWVDHGLSGMDAQTTGGRVRAQYEAAIAEAERRGLRFTSDDSVTAGAQRVYEALARRGYDVERNPLARDAVPPEVITPRAMTPDGSPVYTVRQSAARRMEAAAAAHEQLRALREPQAPRETARATEPPVTQNHPESARQIQLIEQQRGALQSLLECLEAA